MKISIACCTYNGAPFLDKQLRSLTDQTVLPDEIVVVDDGSRDDSVRIATEFARNVDRRVRVVVESNPSNLGVVGNFEKALSRCSGDLVFLCDQDDLWDRRKIEIMSREFDRRSDLLLLFTDARLLDAKGADLSQTLFEALEVSGRERRLIHDGAGFSALIARNLVTGATVALRRTLIAVAAPFPAEWIHDEWLAIVAASIGKIEALDDRLIGYRQHVANQIGVRRLTFPEKVRKASRPRGDYYARLQRRTEILVDRLQALGPRVPEAHLRCAKDKLAHVRFRSALPANRFARLMPIIGEITTGRYRRYSSGLPNIARDCLAPP